MSNEKAGQDQSKTALNALILEYLMNNNYTQSANIFKQESQAKEYKPSRRGAVLLTWFHMFNEVCRIRSGNYDEYDTLVRIESIMIKLEHDKTRCNKHPMVRHFNGYREREMVQNNMKYGTPPHPNQVPHMIRPHPKNMNEYMRNDHPYMMNRPRNVNNMENARNAALRHPQMPPYRLIPHQDIAEREFYRNQNLPIHPSFGENQQFFEHTMKFPQDQAKFNTNHSREVPLEQKDDMKFYNNQIKYPPMSSFIDQKKYALSEMHSNKPQVSPNEIQKSIDLNKNRDMNRTNEPNRINDKKQMGDTNNHIELNRINDRNRINGLDDIDNLNYFEDLGHIGNISDLNGLNKNNLERHMPTISPNYKNKKLNNLKRISLEHTPSSSCIFQDDQHSLLISVFENKIMKIVDLTDYQVIKILQTGLSNVKQISTQKLYTFNDMRSHSDDTNKNVENVNSDFIWVICFNTKDTVTHYCKYLPDFSIISDQTIISQTPVISLSITHCYAFLLTETDLFFFNLQTEIVEKISKLSKNDVKDFLYINQAVFILKTRTKTVTWNVMTNYQQTLFNEPALHMVSTTIQPQERLNTPPQQFNNPNDAMKSYHNPNNQFSVQPPGNKVWHALLFKEFVQVLDHNLNFYSRIPLMHRLSTLSIFDQHNIFTSVHKRIIWYHNTEDHPFDEHYSSIVNVFSYKKMNGRIGLVSIASTGEALISEL